GRRLHDLEPDMAKQETVSTDTLAELTGAIKALADQGRRKQVPVHQYTPQTPWNPSGTKRRVKLKHPAVFQNGARLNPMMLSDEEIELLNRLRPGVYNRKKW